MKNIIARDLDVQYSFQIAFVKNIRMTCNGNMEGEHIHGRVYYIIISCVLVTTVCIRWGELDINKA